MKKHDSPKSKSQKNAFHTPFKGLKLATPIKPSPGPPARSSPRQDAPSGVNDDELFLQAMAGVDPVPNRRAVQLPTVPLPVITNDDAEALARLAELVSGQGPFDISDTDEFIEGVAPDVDRRVLDALRHGDFAVQGHRDLHGMTKLEARESVESFLASSRLEGKRCVLLVHGRGLNSKDHIPVLKEQLKVWLKRGRISRGVLAFATARPHDGGAGALYVLLRR